MKPCTARQTRTLSFSAGSSKPIDEINRINSPLKTLNIDLCSKMSTGTTLPPKKPAIYDRSSMFSKITLGISPTEYTNQYKTYIENFISSTSARRDFIYTPAPKTEGFVHVKLYIVKTGITSKSFELRSAEKSLLLMNAVRKISFTPYYVISLGDSKYNRFSDQFIGKIRGNIYKTRYAVYDNGVRPSKSKDASKNRNEYLAVIFKQLDYVKSSTVKSMHAIIPKSKHEIIKCSNYDDEVLLDPYIKGSVNKLIVFRNKNSKYDAIDKLYKVGINGISWSSNDCLLMLDGTMNPINMYIMVEKVNKNDYNIYYRYPLSLYQAFCLSVIYIIAEWNVV